MGVINLNIGFLAMVRRICAVVGCNDLDSHRHRFPNPAKNKDLFQRWIQLTGDVSLYSLSPSLVYSSCRVCHRHFRDEDRATNMYLKKGSVPMLHLPPLRDTTLEIIGKYAT